VPIDPSLIDFKMMTYPERKWLKEYHEIIFAVLKDKMNAEEREWLEVFAGFYKVKMDD
jgi:hypothetical protein